MYLLDCASSSVFEEPNKLVFVHKQVDSRENQTTSAIIGQQRGLKGLVYTCLSLTFLPAWSDFVLSYLILI